MILFIYFLIYFFLVFVLRSFLLWKKTGVNPLTFNRGDDAHGYNGKVFGVISFIELIVVSIYAFIPSLHKYFLPFWYLENESLQHVGWVLLVLSLYNGLVSSVQYEGVLAYWHRRRKQNRTHHKWLFCLLSKSDFLRNYDCKCWTISSLAQCLHFVDYFFVHHLNQYSSQIGRRVSHRRTWRAIHFL